MVEWQSILLGSGITLVVVVLALVALVSLLFGKVRENLKLVLGKLYTRTSLMLIAIFDVVAAFDPSQTFLGIGAAPVVGAVVFLSEYFLHAHKSKAGAKGKAITVGSCIAKGIIAAIIIAIPLPIAGLFVAWFGLYEPKMGKA